MAFLWLLTLVGLRAETPPLEMGAAIPEVTVLSDEGKPVTLSRAAAKGYALVYFYPKADTPGCTAQACSLRDEYTALQQKGVAIFGVSADKVEAQAKFREKYHLPFTLLADPEKKVMDAFGVPRMGGFARRQAFLFKDGVLVWRDLKASTKEQAADVLKAIAGES